MSTNYPATVLNAGNTYRLRLLGLVKGGMGYGYMKDAGIAASR